MVAAPRQDLRPLLKLWHGQVWREQTEQPGGRNASHPFTLWEAAQRAGRSELISSIKTQLSLFSCTLQQTLSAERQGHSLIMSRGKWGSWKSWEKLGKTAASSSITLSHHKDSTNWSLLTGEGSMFCPVPDREFRAAEPVGNHSRNSMTCSKFCLAAWAAQLQDKEPGLTSTCTVFTSPSPACSNTCLDSIPSLYLFLPPLICITMVWYCLPIKCMEGDRQINTRFENWGGQWNML